MQETYERSCRGKVQYGTKRKANDAMTNATISNAARLKYGVATIKNHGKLNIYFCKFCGFWHVGHISWEDH